MTFQRGIALSLALLAASLSACHSSSKTTPPVSGGSPPPTPLLTPTPNPSTSPIVQPVAASLNCSTAGAPQSVARAQSVHFREVLPVHMPLSAAGAPTYRTDRIAVQYSLADTASNDRMASALSVGSQTSQVQSLTFDAIGKGVRILSVDPSTSAAQLAALKAAGFTADFVRLARPMSTNALYAYTNDPYYYPGLPGAVNPLYENSNTGGGQWDMHAICAANAWAYALPTSGGGVANNFQQFPHATGDSSVSIAIIDTGVDTTQPELSGGKLIYTETDVNGQTTPNTITDTNGHGTNVAGIAAGDSGNALAFVGTGSSTPLMAFQVFPAIGTPECTTPENCNASTSDIATAVNNAVAKGASVISLSLGIAGTGCPTDPALSPAIANAIAKNVVVVAAAGNETASNLDQPACYPGVIAVGADSLVDSGATITEAVASYSNYNSANSQWGLIAPGGDPTNNDTDALHFIEHIWSSTASEPGNCTPPFNSTTPVCRIGIAGTSQATPHVAGTVALLLAVARKDLSKTLTPSQVFSILCTSAKSIGDPKQGCGRLDMYHAMASLVSDPKYP